MGCLKLTYYQDFEPQKNTFGEELTTKISSKSLYSSYLFGFQNQEKDDEWTGQTGSHLNYKYRMYDARIGRFFAIDPLASKYPYNSTYAFSENRVIDKIELEGLETADVAPRDESFGSTLLGILKDVDDALTGSSDGFNLGSKSSDHKDDVNWIKENSKKGIRKGAELILNKGLGVSKTVAIGSTYLIKFMLIPLEIGGGDLVPLPNLPTPDYSSEEDAVTYKYHVIYGSFENETKAKKHAESNNGTVLPPTEDGMYRVSIYGSNTMEDAQSKQKESGLNTWILPIE